MSQKKALRRRCDRPACGKLYRYSDPRSPDLFLDLPEEPQPLAPKGRCSGRTGAGRSRAPRTGVPYGVSYAGRRQPSVNGRSKPTASPRLHHAPPRPHLHPRQHPGPYTHISRPEPEPQVVIILYRKPYTDPALAVTTW